MTSRPEAESLRQRLSRDRTLGLEETLRIVSEVAAALDALQARGVVHRGVRPENIVLTARGARLSEPEGAPAMAAADSGVNPDAIGAPVAVAPGAVSAPVPVVAPGAAAYASPEQAGGRQDLDARSDQYSLACVVYEMLAGAPPFSGATPDRVLYQHLVTRPRPIGERRQGVPPDVSAALARALAKAPSERYASASAFVNELIDSARGSEMLEPKRRVSTVLLVAIPFVALLIALVAGWVGRSCMAGR